MRLYDIRGKLIWKNCSDYLIDWDKKSRSKLQLQVKQFFRPFWEKHLCYEEFPVFGTRLKVDFLNITKALAIEVQGCQHTEFNKFFHKYPINYYQSLKRDERKSNWLKMNKFQLIELTEDDLPQLSEEYFLKTFGVYLV